MCPRPGSRSWQSRRILDVHDGPGDSSAYAASPVGDCGHGGRDGSDGGRFIDRVAGPILEAFRLSCVSQALHAPCSASANTPFEGTLMRYGGRGVSGL